ncbi:MAG: hypothetical protein ACOWWM_13530 [Desulfobacterales bacterium]
MAKNPDTELWFEGGCPDCGERRVDLPQALPEIGDDFDWRVRDFDGFRRFMLEELAARFPERTRWTPADMEVALVEALAALLDQLSDMLDRVAGEAFLETARRPESVRRLLKLIGCDVLETARLNRDAPFDRSPAEGDPRSDEERFDQFWLDHPALMEAARRAGPRAVHTQRRMVTARDYAERLEDHPLVMRANAWSEWSGSWTTLRVAVVLWNDTPLDEALPDTPQALEDLAEALDKPVRILEQEIERLKDEIDAFHRRLGLELPDWSLSPVPRTVLHSYLDAYRMAGQEVLLQDALPVGIRMAISIRVDADYFQSEIRRAVIQALGRGPGGFFEPGRLRFGEDLHAGDIFQTLMALDGVEAVCLNRFKRVGRGFPDQSGAGRIVLDGLEIAVCDNEPGRPERGYFTLLLHGGLKG